MINRMQDLDDELKTLQPVDCIFRINKDERFSKDKSPYKLQNDCHYCQSDTAKK